MRPAVRSRTRDVSFGFSKACSSGIILSLSSKGFSFTTVAAWTYLRGSRPRAWKDLWDCWTSVSFLSFFCWTLLFFSSFETYKSESRIPLRVYIKQVKWVVNEKLWVNRSEPLKYLHTDGELRSAFWCNTICPPSTHFYTLRRERHETRAVPLSGDGALLFPLSNTRRTLAAEKNSFGCWLHSAADFLVRWGLTGLAASHFERSQSKKCKHVNRTAAAAAAPVPRLHTFHLRRCFWANEGQIAQARCAARSHV